VWPCSRSFRRPFTNKRVSRPIFGGPARAFLFGAPPLVKSCATTKVVSRVPFVFLEWGLGDAAHIGKDTRAPLLGVRLARFVCRGSPCRQGPENNSAGPSGTRSSASAILIYEGVAISGMTEQLQPIALPLLAMPARKKNRRVVALGRNGGEPRLETMTSEEWRDIARKAARARWAKKKG